MSNYYEELIEKIMKEALTETYWNKEEVFCNYYDQFLKELPETVNDMLEKVMEHYEMIEAQILKEMYLRGALDLESMYTKGMDVSSSMKALGIEYGKRKKQIYDQVSLILKARDGVHNEWSRKRATEKQLYKEMSDRICHQYEALMKRKKAVGAVERKCMYLQGALDRSRMLS